MKNETENKLEERTDNKDRDNKADVMFEIKTIRTGLKAARQGCADSSDGGVNC